MTARQNLADVCPLDTPFKIYIETSGGCNFNCRFCPNNNTEEFKPRHRNMHMTTFLKIVADLEGFPKHVPHIIMQLNGEPLLNPSFPEFVSVINAYGTRISAFTNASLLTEDVAERIISAGLDELTVSLEGIDDDAYSSICRTKYKYADIIKNIKFYYKKSRGTKSKIFIKLFDNFEKDVDLHDLRAFMECMCDSFSLVRAEPVSMWPYYHGTFTSMGSEKAERLVNVGEEPSICPEPFISLSICSTGDVLACCADWMNALFLGNVEKQSLLDIWNGEKRQSLLLQHLTKRRSELYFCNDCDRIWPDKIDEKSASTILRKMLNV